MRKIPKRIRRCKYCGYKTHHALWKDKVCPICESAEGYSESTHGGLNTIEIEIEKQKVLSTIQKRQGGQ